MDLTSAFRVPDCCCSSAAWWSRWVRRLRRLSRVLASATLWGLGTFAANSVQQARLAGIAPNLTSASIALNTSAIYFGQAAGAGIGGTLIQAGMMPELPLAATAILLRRSGRVHSGSTVGEVRARRQVNADSEACPP